MPLTGSWRTSIVGYVMIASGILGLIADAVSKQGVPDTFVEWMTFGTLITGGIMGLLAKDAVVSNAPRPAAATVVSALNEATPNPSALAPVVPPAQP